MSVDRSLRYSILPLVLAYLLCCFSCLVLGLCSPLVRLFAALSPPLLCSGAGVSSPGRRRGQDRCHGRQTVAHTACSPLPFPLSLPRPREKQEPMRLGTSADAGVVRTMLKSTTNCLPAPGLLSGLTPEAFLEIWYRRKAAEVWSQNCASPSWTSPKADEFQLGGFRIRDFRLLGGLPSKADELHLPGMYVCIV